MNIYDAAKFFLSRVDAENGVFVTHLKLQKLVYYAQAWHLTIHERRLFDTTFEAWAHGPVSPVLFHIYKDYGYSPIPFPEDYSDDLNSDDKQFLSQIWDLYGRFDAKYLERLTHQETPWIEARGNLPEGARCDTVIDEDTIKVYYGSLLVDEE